MPIKVDVEDRELVEKIVDQTWAYLEGEYYYDELPYSYKFSGFIQEMDDEEQKYYDEAIEYYEIEDYSVSHMINTESKVSNYLVTFIFGFIFAIVAVVILILYFGPFSTKKIKKYVEEKNLLGREDMLLREFENAKKVKGSIRMGANYMFYGNGLRGHMVAYEDIIWAYVDIMRNKNAESYTLVMTTIDKQQNRIGIGSSRDEAEEVTDFIFEKNPYILVGKENEYMNLYNSNFQALVNMVKTRASQSSELEESYESYENSTDEF